MYVTPAALAELPGAQELSQVASTAHDAALVDYALMDATLRGGDRSAFAAPAVAAADMALQRIEAAIEEADGVIDGFLRMRRYALPLSPVPSIVVTWARAITRYLLHKDRLSADSTDPIVRDYNDAMKLLRLVADGKFSLGADDTTAPTSSGSPQFDAPPRVFDRNGLADY